MTDEEIGAVIRGDLYWVREALIEAEFQYRKKRSPNELRTTPYTALLERLPTSNGNSSTWAGPIEGRPMS